MPPICNGHASLCDRPVDEVRFAATHNSMSSAERGWLFPNQNLAIPGQLDAGIRGLNIDLWTGEDGELLFCHSYCSLGQQDMVEGFTEINTWLDTNPQEVLLLTFESYVAEADVVWALEQAGLAHRAHSQAVGATWPSLEDLLDAGTPVAIFSSDATGDVSWHMPQWDHWVETPYGHQSLSDLGNTDESCTIARGEASTATLFGVNHFMTAPLASAEDAALVNEADPMAERVAACEQAVGHKANQVLVDFFDLGGVLEIVETLNLSGN